MLGQIGDIAAAVPAGLGHLAHGVGMTVAAPARMVRDIATGDTGSLAAIAEGAFNPREGLGTVADVATGRDSERARAYREYMPLASEVIDSLENTAMRVRHPSRYARAVDESGIVGAILEDVGNVALVGGPAAKALTSAGGAARTAGLARTGAALESTGRGLGTVARLGNAIDDAPIAVPRRIVQAAGRAVIDRALPRLASMSPTVEGAIARSPQFLTSEGRAMRRTAHDWNRAAESSSTRVARELFRSVERNNLSDIEQQAAAALVRGQADLFRAMSERTGRPVADIADIAQPDKLPESYVTPEAAELAVDITRGTADPDLVARLTPYMDELRRQRDIQTQRALAGEGRDTALFEEQVTSNDPLTIARQRAIDEGVDLDPSDPMNYAARWRPLMTQARTVAEATGADLPTTPQALTELGVNAEYLPGGRARAALNTGSRRAMNLENEGQVTFGDVRLADEFQRGADAIAPSSAAGLADKLMRAERQAVLNEGYRDLLGTHGRDYRAVLGDELDGIEATARERADRMHVDEGRRKAAFVEERGQAVIDRMAEAGFEPWPVKGAPDKTIRPSQVDDVAWLPAGMKQSLMPFWNPKPPGAVLRGLQYTNAKFKGAVLPFSLRWQIGDAVSNMMMAALAGGVDPITMFRRMREARRLMDSPEGARVLDQAYAETGLFFDEQEKLRGGPSPRAERRDLPVIGQRRPVKAVQQRSYRINETINRVERQAFFLEKLHRQLARNGIDVDGLETLDGRIDDPKIAKAIEKAVGDTNFVLGNMANLAPFERRVMRQIMPFYPWLRHVSKLATGLALDHPLRLVFMMRIGSLAADGDMEDMPPFLRGSVQGPGGWWQTSFVNPLADVETLPALSPEGAMKALAPGIKVAASALTGADLNRGGLQITRPSDTGRRDWYLRDAINPLIFDPGGLAYQVARQLPITREAWNQGFGPDARFGTGETITDRYGRSIDPGNRLESLPRLFGIPLPTPNETVEKIRAQRAERARAQRRRQG